MSGFNLWGIGGREDRRRQDEKSSQDGETNKKSWTHHEMYKVKKKERGEKEHYRDLDTGLAIKTVRAHTHIHTVLALSNPYLGFAK